MRSLRDIYQQFPNAKQNGLTDTEVSQSLQQYGANRLTPLPKEPIWKKFLGKFDEPIIKILLGATLLKTVVDLFDVSALWGSVGLGLILAVVIAFSILKLGQWLPAALFGIAFLLVGISVAIGHPSYEGLAVMMAVILATGVAFISEYRSDREFEVLNTQKDSIQVKVQRNNVIVLIPLEEVVVGDLVLLEMGDEVPADGRVVTANELMIDQSLMTGESEPVRKLVRPIEETVEGPDQPGCVYRGTQLVDGKAEMIVTEVGDMTMLGQIARRLSMVEDEPEESEGEPDTEEKRIRQKLSMSKEQTPLQMKLTYLADVISKVGYAAAIAIFFALLIRGILIGEVQLTSEAEAMRATISNILGYFVYMVIIVVVAVPEGLPMSVTVSLALAMRKMTRERSLVRQLVACETIGSATVICSDKTGTLTQNKMQVDQVSFDQIVYKRNDANWPKVSSLSNPVAPMDWLALNSVLNSTANLEMKERKLVVIGNSTEGALLQWAGESNVEYAKVRDQHPTIYQMHFTSDRKRMTSVVDVNGKLLTLVKGAPEIILEHCTKYLAHDGTEKELTAAARLTLLEQLKEAASQAMRTLAFAHRTLPANMPRNEDQLHERQQEIESELVFTGFVAIRDPLRPEVKDAMAKCRDAGIEVKMITGDNIETARAIGREIGLLDQPDALAITSEEFNRMTDEELKERMSRLRILARARPLDKFRMVKLLQEQEHVVAVTGDGTNDAPALKKADVGLAMGIAGTEVAKEASKIVLLDDSFATIVKAVHWGRSLYENIQRFIQFQLTINVSALAIAFLGPFFGVKPPFTVLQLLWINVIMDTFAAIALCSEPPREGLMRMRPKRRDESIVTPNMLKTILITAGFFVVVMMGLLLIMKGNPENPGWQACDGAWLVENKGSTEFASKSELSKTEEGTWQRTIGEKTIPVLVNFTVHQVTLFFTIYVLFQVWNQINCRSLTPERSGLAGLFSNPSFLGIASLILIGQIIIVTFGGSIFMVESLDVMDWIWIALGTSSVLIFAEVARQLRK